MDTKDDLYDQLRKQMILPKRSVE